MKSSTAGLEKRKPSAKSMSSKSAPTKTSTANSHEMAPFFSIFYRGISSKINRSSSKIELDGQNEQLNITNKKFISTSSSSDKPPIIPSALKGAKGNNVGDATLYRRATAPSNIKSRSTVELAKERALAEGKNWRENIEQTKSTINLNNSAPTSPQRQRRWPFNIKGTKTQSQELINSLEQNNRISISSNSLIINNKQKELLPPIPIKRKQGQQQQQQKELPQSCEVFQSIPSSFIIQKSSNLPFQKISVENNFPPPSSSSSPPLFSNSPLLLPFNEKPPLSPSSSLPMSFVQRIRLHKGVRTGKLPVDALKQQTPGFEIGRGERFFGSRRISKKGMPPNSSIYMSADAINELRNDPDYIVEALMAIGDEQPKVARSTPKHSFISQDIKKVNERLSRNCIYKSDVYEKMVNDSLLVCDLLKDHLDNVINGVRAKSPTALSSPFTTPPGSPFMTRSTSLHLNNSTNNKPINRITISISPMAQQAKNNNLIINNNKQNISSSKHNLPLYLTKQQQQQQSPPLLKITKPSFKEEYLQKNNNYSITSINSNINTKHLHFI